MSRKLIGPSNSSDLELQIEDQVRDAGKQSAGFCLPNPRAKGFSQLEYDVDILRHRQCQPILVNLVYQVGLSDCYFGVASDLESDITWVHPDDSLILMYQVFARAFHAFHAFLFICQEATALGNAKGTQTRCDDKDAVSTMPCVEKGGTACLCHLASI